MTTKQELKKMLADSYNLQSELIDLVKECLKEIFPDSAMVLYNFDEDVEEGMEWNGCLQPLSVIRQNYEREKPHDIKDEHVLLSAANNYDNKIKTKTLH